MGKPNASENIDYIKPLSSYAEPNEVGGKAYNLMKLSHAHYNIVVGFTITTEVYRYWKKNGKLPKEFFDKLDEYLKWFSYGMKFPVIVRSSATVEDAKKASFAGLFTSYPNANSIEDIIERIERIYSDANSKRVADYCKLHNIDTEKVEMAVLVQKQLNPEYSGILFTRNPVNGEDEAVLEYVKGVPWDLASGSEIHTNRMILTDKSKKFRKLYNIAKEMEEFFASPQDIEWAYDGKVYWILQSRPITTLGNKVLNNIKEPKRSEVILNGTTASLGYAKGKVQYIFDDLPVEEAEKVFKEGNILVTWLLYPEYDTVISKAKGIIAKEDSINSHVAILSRERKIPCIVGVDLKEFSRYVGDFDEVIVDADNGRILIPKPKVSKIRDTSKLIQGKMPEWTQHLDPEGHKIIMDLRKAVRNEDIEGLDEGIEKAIAYMMDNAVEKPEAARPLFHRLAGFLQDDFAEILLKKYPREKVLERFTFVDSNPNAEPQEFIDKIYKIANKYTNNLDLLEVNGKKLYQLQLKDDKKS